MCVARARGSPAGSISKAWNKLDANAEMCIMDSGRGKIR